MVLAQPEYSDAVDKGCPMVLGGPLSHVMAAKAVALAEARQPAFQAYAQRVADNAQALADGFLKRDAGLVTAQRAGKSRLYRFSGGPTSRGARNTIDLGCCHLSFGSRRDLGGSSGFDEGARRRVGGSRKDAHRIAALD